MGRSALAAAAALLLRVGSQEEQEVVVACVTGVAENEVSDPASEQEQGIRQDNADNPIDHEEQMRVALTFDDGPHPVYTPRLLDGLKARGVHASFFMVGKTRRPIRNWWSGFMRKDISSVITPIPISS